MVLMFKAKNGLSAKYSVIYFQYGGVCLHFTPASFNTVCGKSNLDT